MKVVIARDASEKTRKLMASQFPEQWQVITVAAGNLIDVVRDAEVIIPEGAAIDRRLLAQAETLKIVQTGAGYDNVDIEACTERGVWVANAAGINARAVAEHVFAFILCWYKSLALLDRRLRRGGFHEDYRGAVVSGKVIGIVGLGNIGAEVARLAQAFDMQTLAYHYRRIRPPKGVTMVGLPVLLKESDVISLHVASNSRTRRMIAKPQFEIMKPDAFLINTCRGAVVDESALIEVLRQNRIGGAGLDVFQTEPLPDESPLRKLDNVILSPHTAGEPDGLFLHKERFQFFAANITRVSKGLPPLQALNDLTGQSREPGRRIRPIQLPEGYDGKILLVSLSGEGIGKTVLLRSGDLWHREILRNTELEIKNLGFENVRVHELGGALVRFEPDGVITVYGASQEFGACDKEMAAEIIRKKFEGRTVRVRP